MPKPRSRAPACRSKPSLALASSTRSIPKGCSAAVSSCAKSLAVGPLEFGIGWGARQERLQGGGHFFGIPFGGALNPAHQPALAVDDQRRRQPAHRESVADRAFRIEVDHHLVEAELGDKRFDHLVTAAVLGNRRDDE